MKRQIRILFVLLMIISVCSAQSRFKVGLTSGPTFYENLGVSTDAKVWINLYKNLNFNVSVGEYMFDWEHQYFSVIPYVNYTTHTLPINWFFELGLGWTFGPEIESVIIEPGLMSAASDGKGQILTLGTGILIPIVDRINLCLNLTALHPTTHFEYIDFGIGFLYQL